jgi:hypothetical protein
MITGELPAIESEAAICNGLANIASAKAVLKKMEEEFNAVAIGYMKDNGIKSIQFSDTAKLILSVAKKDRFESEYIKEKLGFTPRQLAVLPLNPAWKKTAILADEELAPAHSIEESDKLELKFLDEKYLKK